MSDIVIWIVKIYVQPLLKVENERCPVLALVLQDILLI